MAHIGLICCVRKKRRTAGEAKDLYDSPLFTKSRDYVTQHCDSWFILSAKYGLVTPTDVIEPYEETLNTKSRQERVEWTGKVWSELRRRIRPGDLVTILAGERYREGLAPLLTNYGCRVKVPMEGLRIGCQLQWLSRQMELPHQDRDVDRLYRSLHRLRSALGGERLMSQATGRQGWPKRGVYFFFEPGEVRTGSTEPRVVRIGTHAVSHGSKTTLWNRLRTHRGTSEGRGNRQQEFRSGCCLVGRRAIDNRSGS